MTEPDPRPGPTGGPKPVDYVDVFGVHVHPDEIAAQYRAEPDTWTDMPEARPRARCQLKSGKDRDPQVFVMDDGSLRYDKTDVQVDEYPGAEYAEVRAEGERRWERIDKARGGPVKAGPVLVGESGPEIPGPPAGSRVAR